MSELLIRNLALLATMDDDERELRNAWLHCKDGVIIAVEAFEGTNQTIKRAGRVGKAGSCLRQRRRAGRS